MTFLASFRASGATFERMAFLHRESGHHLFLEEFFFARIGANREKFWFPEVGGALGIIISPVCCALPQVARSVLAVAGDGSCSAGRVGLVVWLSNSSIRTFFRAGVKAGGVDRPNSEK